MSSKVMPSDSTTCLSTSARVGPRPRARTSSAGASAQVRLGTGSGPPWVAAAAAVWSNQVATTSASLSPQPANEAAANTKTSSRAIRRVH